MATYYVSHAYGGKEENYNKAKEITRKLQVERPQDCFVCPLMAFSHLEYGEFGYDYEIELCLDLLSICDGLIVASEEISKGVQIEIDFAKMVDMEVEYIEPQNPRRCDEQ
jgi:hypothetical protein